ncbi:MAG TPA: Ni/Fe-hydrogenase cytochrome b subunit [Pyrinomonadaceae bacterium]|nr:Ni/Fe-hydrogenase cytochrome b subunit [Pyrinomonadaceae bacterium]
MSKISLRLPRITFWRVILLAILALGAYATFVRFTRGLGASTNLSTQFPWGIWIGFDVLCGVALAAGGFTISAVVYIFHIEKYRPIVRPAILTAFLGYSLVVVGLMFDLGRPYNIWHPLIMWNPHSVMFEVGWCVTLYTTVLMLEFSPLVLEKLPWKKPYHLVKSITIPLVILGVLLSTMHQSSLGTLYLIVPHKLHPLWYSPLLPVYFFISAIALGCAMTIFESYLSLRAFRKHLDFHLLTKLGAVAAVTLSVYLAIRLTDMQSRGVLSQAFQPTYEGRMFLAEMLLGVIAPIVMLFIPRIRNNQFGLFTSALMVVLGFVMNRINVAITGMDQSSGVHYFPSLTELAVTGSIVGFGFLLFGLAVKYLDVFPPEDMKEIASGRRAELPALVAFRAPLWSATTAAFVMAMIFMAGSVALSYDGIRLRTTVAPLSEGTGNVDVGRGLTELKMPSAIAIKMGKTSPGQCVFSHDRHINKKNPSCNECHSGLFRMLPTTADITPDKKMTNCGTCHDGVKAVGVRDNKRCDSCHAKN